MARIPSVAPVLEPESPVQAKSKLPGLEVGPHQEVHAFWLAGMSCDGCSIAAVGATQPSVESLLLGNIPGVPKVVLHHPLQPVGDVHRADNAV